jgi:hypothetical protein
MFAIVDHVRTYIRPFLERFFRHPATIYKPNGAPGLLDRWHCDNNISINNDPLNANEGSTDSSRRQLQFGTMYHVCFVKHQVPTNTNVDWV